MIEERNPDGTVKKSRGRKPGSQNRAVASARERFAQLLEGNMPKLEAEMAELDTRDHVEAMLRLAQFVVPKPTEQMEYNSTHYAKTVELVLAHAASLGWNEDFPQVMVKMKEILRLAALKQWGELETK